MSGYEPSKDPPPKAEATGQDGKDGKEGGKGQSRSKPKAKGKAEAKQGKGGKGGEGSKGKGGQGGQGGRGGKGGKGKGDSNWDAAQQRNLDRPQLTLEDLQRVRPQRCVEAFPHLTVCSDWPEAGKSVPRSGSVTYL